MNTTCEAYLLLCVCLLAGGCKEQPVSTQTGTAAPQMEVQQEPLQPLPVVAPQDRKVVALGAALFSETRLSSDGTVACASCHDLAKGGQDGRRVSLGVGGLLGEVNAPSVLNSGLNFVQFWDGRAASLEDQAGAPLTNPREMKSTWANVLSFLRTDPEYDQRFRLAFGTQADEASVRSALASFERSLITRNSRFDRWLGGEKTLTPNEVAGYERFKGVGCIACHQGANVGGNMFQRFGVMGEYFEDRGHIQAADYGRFNVTHLESDRFVFRVPSLRNVELTAPYFHDGSAATLESAVGTMGKYQLGKNLGEADVARIVAFLKTLTGDQPVDSGRVARQGIP